METINSIFVECRKWQDKTYGNTYFSNRIQIDGKLICQTGKKYGYGNMYLYDAMNTLEKMGLIPTAEIYELTKLGVVVYNAESFVLKRDLFRDYNPETNN